MKKQKGFAAIFVVILILSIFIIISMGLFVTTLSQQVIANNNVRSTQSYYAAEAGIEDTLFLITRGFPISENYQLIVGQASVDITISEDIGGSRNILSEGNLSGRIRKVETTFSVLADKIRFHYGAHVGEGGIEMQNNSIVQGNVFSNGSIIRTDGNPKITGTAIIAGNGNRIFRIIVDGDVRTDICENSSNISGKLYYRTSMVGCSASGGHEVLTEEIEQIDLPISKEQIDTWKEDAEEGDTMFGNYTINSGTHFLGPTKIEGNLTVQSGTKLRITGTIWVTGKIEVHGGNTEITLDPNSYGRNGGMIIADGQINISGTPKILGTGLAGSYLMLISEFDSTENNELAIKSIDSPKLDILYARIGKISFEDTIELREVNAWGLKMIDGSKIIYESGLANAAFSSGPGGAWNVISWKEVE